MRHYLLQKHQPAHFNAQQSAHSSQYSSNQNLSHQLPPAIEEHGAPGQQRPGYSDRDFAYEGERESFAGDSHGGNPVEMTIEWNSDTNITVYKYNVSPPPSSKEPDCPHTLTI